MPTLPAPCPSVQLFSSIPEATTPHLAQWLALAREAHARSGSNVQLASVRSLAEVLHAVSAPNAGVSWYCNATLGDRAGMKTSTVQRVLRILESAGLVQRYEGDVAYWTSRAYGGAVPDGRYRVLCLSPWRYRLAHDRASCEAILRSNSRVVSFRKHRVIPSASLEVLGNDRTPLQGGAGVASCSPAPNPEQTEEQKREKELAYLARREAERERERAEHLEREKQRAERRAQEQARFEAELDRRLGIKRE